MNYRGRAKKSGWRKTLRKYQGNLCCWCKKPMQTTNLHGWDFETIEHLKPKSIGGRDAIENLALAHAKCNNERPRNELKPPAFTGRLSPTPEGVGRE